LARPEDEVARRDLVAERLADLRDAERQLAPRRLQHVVEVDEDALGRLRTQIRERRVLLHGPHEGLEHEVELARRRELALAALRAERAADAAVLARLAGLDGELVALGGRTVVRPVELVDLVGTEAPLALAAIDHGIGEVVQMPAGLPHHGVHEDGRVQPHHVVALVDEVAPPDALDVVPQLHAERAVVPARTGAAVDLARLEDEAAPLAQRNDHVHGHRSCWGPRHGPQTPTARRAPAKPWRASITRERPRHGPQTPTARRAPAKPWRASTTRQRPRPGPPTPRRPLAALRPSPPAAAPPRRTPRGASAGR